MADRTALRIGIQIRVGDVVFSSKDQFHAWDYAHFFKCAARIEKRRRKPWHTKVVWYLASDSLSIRREAKAFYGRKLVTNTRSRAMHVGKDECKSQGKCVLQISRPQDRRVVKEAFRGAVAELYLLSMAQYHVLTDTGSFGQMGAWLSGETSHPHSYLLKLQKPSGGAVNCSRGMAVPFAVHSRVWSGR
jgi:hypothetical protein